MIPLIRRLLSHAVYLNIAFSETGSLRPFKLRTIWVFAVGGVLTSMLFGSAQFGMWLGTPTFIIGSGGDLAPYLRQIEILQSEKEAQDQQFKLLAQELGVLQARLDRFDILGQKLSSGQTEQGLEDGRGDGSAPTILEVPEFSELKEGLEDLSARAGTVEELLQERLAMAQMQGEQAEKPYFWPVVHENTRITSNFGWRSDPFFKRRSWHGGIDITGEMGAPVSSAADGVVVFTGYRFNYGIMVEVRHPGGYATRYGHLSRSLVRNGDTVKVGSLIALMGSTGRSTGPHLHFEVLKDDVRLDPSPYVIAGQKKARELAKAGYGRRQLQLASTSKVAAK